MRIISISCSSRQEHSCWRTGAPVAEILQQPLLLGALIVILDLFVVLDQFPHLSLKTTQHQLGLFYDPKGSGSQALISCLAIEPRMHLF